MAYIGITEAQSNPFAPLTSELIKQLRDNPIAIAVGDPNAPKIRPPALERLQPGGAIRSRKDESVTASGIEILHEFGFIQHGTIRCMIEKTTGAGNVRVSRVRNGAEFIAANRTEDGIIDVNVAVIPGDTIKLTVINATARNARFLTNGQDLWPGPVDVRVEGNRAAP